MSPTTARTSDAAGLRQVRPVAGSIVLASVSLSLVVRRAQVVAGVVGAGLTFAAVSNSCATGSLLMKLPYNKRASYDVRDVVGRLADTTAGSGRG